MKNCGHMFREKLPFSDLWEELHKVAILKRKVRRLMPCAAQIVQHKPSRLQIDFRGFPSNTASWAVFVSVLVAEVSC